MKTTPSPRASGPSAFAYQVKPPRPASLSQGESRSVPGLPVITPPVGAHYTLQSLHSELAARSPNAAAVTDHDKTYSHLQLDRRANFFARQLARAKVLPGTPVALILPRSVDLVAAILATLKLGAFYLPLDSESPASRIQICLNDARPVVLTTRNLAREFGLTHAVLIDGLGTLPTFTSPHSHSQETACLIYTSGNRSIPKGVEITHAGLLHRIASLRDTLCFSPDEVFLSASPASSIAFTLEIFLPLLSGLLVTLTTSGESRDPWLLSRRIETSGCTVLHATPTMWESLLSIGWNPPRPMKILSSGEVLSRDLANRLLEQRTELWNLYSATETTFCSLVHRVQPGDGPVPIGKALGTSKAIIADEHRNPLPVNTPGELYLSGAAIAPGYRGQPALTAPIFVSLHGQHGELYYRTGDRALIRPDGIVEYRERIEENIRSVQPQVEPFGFHGWSTTEKTIAALWTEVLRTPASSLDDDFFDLGGHSLVVARLQHRFVSTFGRPVTMAALFHTPTIRGQAAIIESLLEPRNGLPAGILPLQPTGTEPSLFWFHPTPFVKNLVRGMGDEHPFIACVLTPDDIEQIGPQPTMQTIAARHAEAILQTQPRGPFYLGGYCIGGIVAYAVADHLVSAGHEVELVVLLDSQNPVSYRRFDRLSVEMSKIRFYLHRALARKPSATSLADRLIDRLKSLLHLQTLPGTEMSEAEHRTSLASAAYRPPSYSGSVLLLQPEERPAKVNYRPGWLTVIQPGLEIQDVPGHHDELLAEQNAPAVARAIKDRIRQHESQRVAKLRSHLKTSA